MAQGWELFTSLEINGSKVFSSTGMKVDTWDYVRDLDNFLNYVNRCRIISEALQYKINYTSNVTYTGEEHRHLAEIATIIKGEQVFYEKDIKGNVTSGLVAENECKNIKALASSIEPISMRTVLPSGEKIKLFGVDVVLPEKTISLDSVSPVFQGNIDKLKDGDIIKVEWVPQKGFKGRVNYNINRI